MFRFNRVWMCGVVAVVLGLGLLASSGFAQPVPGGGSWGIVGTDLAADRIEFRMDQKYDASMAKISIVGYVKHVKGGNFKGAGSARLYEVVQGKENLVAQAKLPALQPGQEFAVSYQRKWGLNWVNMPTQYKLVVQADPDSLGDDPSNNVKVRSAADINGLFVTVQMKQQLAPATGILKQHPGPFRRIK
jgi:hypothetical protein